ncbi:MAG TPA: hydrogenase/urease maturation nickel metallochaperone HypA, partial [Candidatus Thermoplasmatota archaeon]|nr:hydrogenase/urease maturation nickel metallochaperone HypA [Candidatus Thermoplasmatota archaeon]
FHFKTQQSTLKCTVCGNEWTYKDMKTGLDEKEAEAIHFIPEVVFVHARCPKCKSPDFEIAKGRGVTLRTIKGTR